MSTNAELKEQLEKLQKDNEVLRVALSNAKVTKEKSDYFKNEKSNEAMNYKSLSETKKYCEVKHADFLKRLVEQNNNVLLSSKDFHNAITNLIQNAQ